MRRGPRIRPACAAREGAGRWLLGAVLAGVLCAGSAAADDFPARVMAARLEAGKDPQLGLASLQRLRAEDAKAPQLAHRLAIDEAQCRILTDLDTSQALTVADAGLAAAGQAPEPPARDPWLRLRVCRGEMLLESGRSEEGRRELDAVLDETADPVDAGVQALARLVRGVQGSREGRLETSQTDLLSACDGLKRHGPPRDHENCLGQLSNHYRRIGDADEALRLLHELNESARQRGATYDVSIYSFGIGQALQALRRWDESLQSLEVARAASEQLGDTLGVAYAEHGIGTALLKAGRPERALALVERALSRLDRAVDPRQFEIMSTTHAQALAALGRATQAMAILDEIGPAVRQRGDTPGLQAWLEVRASAQSQLGRWREAYDALSQARGIVDRLHDQALSEQSARLRMQFNRARDTEALNALRTLNTQGQQLRQTQAVAMALFVLLLAVAMIVAWRKVRQARHLQDLASTDELTGLANRRALMAFSTDAVARAHQQGTALTVLMIDIDHFKRINDAHGHAIGDDVLRRVGRVLPAGLRERDRVGRLGGEEFLAVLPGASVDRAEQVALRMRGAIADTALETPQGALRFSVSIGVAGLQPGETIDRLVARADAALYRAKNEGRDRVVLAA